jgi:hypothetical protein
MTVRTSLAESNEGAFQFWGNLYDASSHRPRGRPKHIVEHRLVGTGGMEVAGEL